MRRIQALAEYLLSDIKTVQESGDDVFNWVVMEDSIMKLHEELKVAIQAAYQLDKQAGSKTFNDPEYSRKFVGDLERAKDVQKTRLAQLETPPEPADSLDS